MAARQEVAVLQAPLLWPAQLWGVASALALERPV
jgi:hypothetical protein